MRIKRFLLVGLMLFAAAAVTLAQPAHQPSRAAAVGTDQAPKFPPDLAAARDAKLTWYGQSFFIVTSRSGARIAFDPYHTGSGINYSPPSVKADVVFISHEHFDHNNAALLKGRPKVIGPLSGGTRSGTLTVGLAKFPYKSIFSYHDAVSGRERGPNTINIVSVDGVRIAHLGDLGAPLSAQQIKDIGPVDILLVPVGGTFTIDAAGATKVVQQLKPKVAIPMHYKTPKVALPLAGVDAFLRGKKNVVRSGSTFSFTTKSLPEGTTIVVLTYEG